MELKDLPLAKIALAKVYAASAYNELPDGTFKTKTFYKSRLTSAEAVLTKLPNCHVLAFKGSKEPMDWLMNITALPFPNRAGLCHAGFGLAHWSLWRQIKKDLSHDKPLLITGHSLGGALAEISAGLLKSKRETVHTWFISFGKPNVWLKGCDPDMTYLDAQVSVVNCSDIVARIPKQMYGPSRTQTMLYFGADDNDYINPSKDLLVKELKTVDWFSHHLMPQYHERIEQMLDRLMDAV